MTPIVIYVVVATLDNWGDSLGHRGFPTCSESADRGQVGRVPTDTKSHEIGAMSSNNCDNGNYSALPTLCRL